MYLTRAQTDHLIELLSNELLSLLKMKRAYERSLKICQEDRITYYEALIENYTNQIKEVENLQRTLEMIYQDNH